jgi:hypothetical protein
MSNPGQPVQVNAIGGTLGNIESAVKAAGRAVGEQTQQFIDETSRSITAILQGVEQCKKKIGEIIRVVANRAVEEQIAMARLMMKLKLMPVELIDKVWDQVSPDLKSDPDPKLYVLQNPHEAVHNNARPVFKTERTTPVAPNVFIHGMGYDGSPEAAFYGFYKDFESQAEMFPRAGPGRFGGIHLLCYKSDLTLEKKTLIQRGIEGIIGEVVSADSFLILSVYWRELERRAREVSRRFLMPIVRQWRGTSELTRFVVVSHSLGCYLFADCAHQLAAEHPRTPQKCRSRLRMVPFSRLE